MTTPFAASPPAPPLSDSNVNKDTGWIPRWLAISGDVELIALAEALDITLETLLKGYGKPDKKQ
jgi:hypothetical protein